jgi:hypothetical protein
MISNIAVAHAMHLASLVTSAALTAPVRFMATSLSPQLGPLGLIAP